MAALHGRWVIASPSRYQPTEVNAAQSTARW